MDLRRLSFDKFLISLFLFVFLSLTTVLGCVGQNNDNTNSSAEDIACVDDNIKLEVEYIDVGQGDSALVSCDNHHLLIDGGNADKSQVVYTVLSNKNIDYLDYIIISHTDADHCGGVSGALNKASVGVCYCSESTDDSKTWNNVIKSLNNQGKNITIPTVGEKIYLGNAEITFLAPFTSNHSDNNNSIVCRIDFGEVSFMFTGDAEEEEEQELISSKANLKADVLKVSHHGSNKCSSEQFLKLVQPKYAVISVGKNSYGHPGKSTLERLNNYTSNIYRTDKHGDIFFTTDGKNISVSQSN